MDDLRRAWAVLDLKPGSSLEALRAQYLNLVRRWHPDRFEKDPVGRAQATEQLQRINAAYRSLLEAAISPEPVRQRASGAPMHDGVGTRKRSLTPEEVEEIKQAMASIGKYSWMEDAFFPPERAARKSRLRRLHLFKALIVASLVLAALSRWPNLSEVEIAFVAIPVGVLVGLVLLVVAIDGAGRDGL